MPRNPIIILAAIFSLSIAGCILSDPTVTIENIQPVSTLSPSTVISFPTATIEEESHTPKAAPLFGYTHQRADGNRFVEGRASLPESTSIEIPLDGTPAWVVAAPYEDTSLWAVVLDDGRVQAFWINPQSIETAQITPDQLNPGSPPFLSIVNSIPELVTGTSPDQSTSTHPIILPISGLRASIQVDGTLSLVDENDQITASLAIDALPDARILSDDSGRLLLLSGSTTKYDHGVLGDLIEASRITLVETSPDPRIISTIPIPNDKVIEGIAPLWVDLNNDTVREIIVTLSDGLGGAQIVVYTEKGEQIAAGDAIGLGYRWRHQIAVAPFGPNGEMELVDVLTPHIGGTVEFFQLDGDRLSKVAQVEGYTSHVIRSRNLDMAAAGDFDGDGLVELLLPNQARTELGAIQRTTEGAEVVWSLPIDGQMNTNLGAITLNNGMIIIGLGRMDNIFKIWLP